MALKAAQRIEWKASWRNEYLKWVCGFFIATVLSDMDAAIDALEARFAKTRALKAGMMQQLLTERIRLK